MRFMRQDDLRTPAAPSAFSAPGLGLPLAREDWAFGPSICARKGDTPQGEVGKLWGGLAAVLGLVAVLVLGAASPQSSSAPRRAAALPAFTVTTPLTNGA